MTMTTPSTLDDQLLEACKDGDLPKVVNLIQEGADVNCIDKAGGCPPLHHATAKAHEAISKHLIENGANVFATCEYGRTALHYASFLGDEAFVKMLVDAGADVNAVSTNGNTPLHVSSLCGHLTIAKLLIENGANRFVRSETNKLPVDLARDEGHSALVSMYDELDIKQNSQLEAKDQLINTLTLDLHAKNAELLALGAKVNMMSDREQGLLLKIEGLEKDLEQHSSEAQETTVDTSTALVDEHHQSEVDVLTIEGETDPSLVDTSSANRSPNGSKTGSTIVLTELPPIIPEAGFSFDGDGFVMLPGTVSNGDKGDEETISESPEVLSTSHLTVVGDNVVLEKTQPDCRVSPNATPPPLGQRITLPPGCDTTLTTPIEEHLPKPSSTDSGKQNDDNSAFVIWPDAIFDDAKEDEGFLPLHFAVKYSDMATLIETLDPMMSTDNTIIAADAGNNSSFLNRTDSEGRTAFDLAALTGQTTVMLWLGQAGSPSNKIWSKMRATGKKRSKQVEAYKQYILDAL